MFPLRARDGGVLVRAGQTEAAVDLARIAGLYPAGVICEIMNDDGTMARVPELTKFARQHKLLMITIADLIRYRMRTEGLVTKVAEADLPTEHGAFRIHGFESMIDKETHSRWSAARSATASDVLVRVHSKCLTGDVFHSARCDCGAQLEAALQQIARAGRGVLLYLNQEGRGIGLANKLRAYALQDQGLDTVEANERLGFKADQRDYGIGAQILRAPRRPLDAAADATTRANSSACRDTACRFRRPLPLEIPASATTRKYLKAKKEKLGHRLEVGLTGLPEVHVG